MTAKKTSPAKKGFRVYANQLMFQDVTAANAKKAHRIAEEELLFEPCESCLTLDPVLKDLESDEYVRVGGTASHCKTCGSEIVATINDSNFRDGECGPCEFERYRSQPELLAHLENIVELAHSVARNWESGDLAAAVRNLDRIATAAEVAITKAHGHSA